MLPELQSLAALASSQDGLVVQRGAPGCPWSFNWNTRVITANPEDLELRPADYCRGLILHESAHAAITRIVGIVPEEWRGARIHRLLNAVEDCRIENWLQARFRGSAAWIKLYNDHLFNRASPDARRRMVSDPAAAFVGGILDRWWNPSPILDLHPAANAALGRIWPHFLEAVTAHPAPVPGPPAPITRAYARHPVALCFQAADRHHPPAAAECEIRMHQHRMWSITWRHIVPEFLALLALPESEPTRSDIEAQQAEAEAHAAAEATAAGHRVWPGTAPFRIDDADGRGASGDSHCTQIGEAVQVPSRSSAPGSTKAPIAPGSASDYAHALAAHGALIEECGRVLISQLTAESRPQRTRFHRSGQRLDLRVAMQYEADPRQHDRLWERVSLPNHPDPAFVVAVDTSGSMRGEKARAAFESVVILREVCLRLTIPLSIIAFNREAKVLLHADHPAATGIAERLAGLLRPGGGTCLAGALQQAATLLLDCPRRDRHLWILSDGETSDADDARGALAAIRAGGVQVHGLGLGAEGDAIRSLVPACPVGLQPEQLPEVFATLLRSQTAPRPGRRAAGRP